MKRMVTQLISGSIFLLLMVLPGLNAQTVETVLSTNDFIIDYLVVGPNGDVYHANRARRIHRITPDGNTSIFATSNDFNFVTGMGFDSQGNLYVTSGGNARIYRVAPNGSISLFAEIGGFPVGIDVDSLDNVYVAMWYSGSVMKITQAGVSSQYVSGIGEGAVDVAFAEDGTMYTANFINGNIFKTSPDGNTTTMIANVNAIAGYLTYAAGYAFVTGYDTHYIYRVSPSGDVVQFAGTGMPGTTDGPVGSAEFNVPNGISATASGDTIYISHDGDRHLRRIIGVNMPNAIGDSEIVAPGDFELFANFPNPFNPETVIRYSLSVNRPVTLKIYDLLGREIKTLVDARKEAGTYTVSWDGRNDAGEAVASGIYLYRLSVNGASVTRRMLLVR